MKKATLVVLVSLMALLEAARAEPLEINGFETTMPDGCRVILSLNGAISNVSLPPGSILRDANGQIKFVGNTQILRDANGQIEFVGNTQILRDANGQIKFIGNTQILRDAKGQLKFIGDTQILRDAKGVIQNVGGSGQVLPVFSLK